MIMIMLLLLLLLLHVAVEGKLLQYVYLMYIGMVSYLTLVRPKNQRMQFLVWVCSLFWVLRREDRERLNQEPDPDDERAEEEEDDAGEERRSKEWDLNGASENFIFDTF